MNLAEWIRATVVVGPADEPMLRRAELLEELAVNAIMFQATSSKTESDRLTARYMEILAALAKEEE